MSSHQEWRVETVAETSSTNADVSERFREGEAEGLVLVADHQTQGRGRLGREWVTSPKSSLIVSFLLVPEGLAPERWPWLPLLTGIATAEAVRRTAGVEVGLKWPNDVLVDERKVGGILVERVDEGGRGGAVVGIGVNVSQPREELPSDLLQALCEELGGRYDDLVAGADLREQYLARCVTLGQQVRVALPGGEVTGEAVDIDDGGRLVVHTAEGEERLGAGDVVHVRPQE
jgi:BirA family biotin operon repressor/biotin-[acetyl-CoA-carboxylase] ligase